MWKEINNLEEAKNLIANPTYKNTGVFMEKKDLIDMVDLKDKRVLDFGCGVGRNMPYILEKGALEVTGYDYPNMIKLAKEYLGEQAEKVKFIEPPIYNLEMYDVIIASLVFQHIEKTELDEVLKALSLSIFDTGVLLVYSRGYIDFTNNNVWECISKYFTPIDDIDMKDKTDKHQKGRFKVL